MNRYVGNSGVVQRIPEPVDSAPIFPRQGMAAPEATEKKSPGRLLQGGGLGSLLSKLEKSAPDLEDLILVALMYLLYRETGDIEFLLTGGVLLLS